MAKVKMSSPYSPMNRACRSLSYASSSSAACHFGVPMQRKTRSPVPVLRIYCDLPPGMGRSPAGTIACATLQRSLCAPGTLSGGRSSAWSEPSMTLLRGQVSDIAEYLDGSSNSFVIIVLKAMNPSMKCAPLLSGARTTP